MSLTQQCVLSLLLSEGGRMKKSELVGRFRDAVDSVDPAEKERNRELFKTFVNNLAFVKEEDGVRYVVLKKAYRHLLESAHTTTDSTESAPTGEHQRPPVRAEGTGSGGDAGEGQSEPDQEGSDSEKPAESLSPFEQALQRSKYPSISVKRGLSFGVTPNVEKCLIRHQQTTNQSKPYSLPLRMPPSATIVQTHKLKVDPDEGPRQRNVSSSVPEMADGVGSPQLKRSVKSTSASEEAKDVRVPSSVPLEQAEHDWLVKCAAGHWKQVYGLLLRDSQLAEKRDFMSGFTALHWAAKYGNGDMLVKIVDRSKQGGVDIDINVKTHGGYTPLHIAALHDRQYIITMLVKEFGANVGVRDNCGKKAYHYLHKDTSESVREMLGVPRAQKDQDRAVPEREELELFPDLSKGLHSISRLFQPHVPGHKKKHKQRPGFYSLSDDPSEDQQDRNYRHRLVSDAFMWSPKEQ